MSADLRVIPLGELVSVKGGKRLPKGTSLKAKPTSHPYIRVRDMGQRYIPTDGLEYVPDDVFPKIKRYIVHENDVIISIVGTIGLVSVIDSRFHLASLTENAAKLTGLDSTDAHYLYYYLNSSIGQAEIAQGTVGAVQPKLPLYNIEKIPVVWPERRTRLQIVNQLRAADDKIQLNHQINQTLEQMAQAIFKSWFVDFEPVKAKIAALDAGGSEEDALLAAMQAISGKDADQLARMQAEQPEQYAELRATAELFPSAMQPSELGEIPEGWEVAPFAELARLDTSSVKPGNSPEKLWEHYSIPAFDNGKSPALELGADIKSNKYKVHPAAVLSSKLNPHFPRTWWPDVTDEMAAICSTEFMQFVPKNPEHRPFVAGMVTSTPFQSGIRSCVSGTTGSRQRAQPKQVAVMEVVLPTAELVMKFSQLAGPLYQMQARNIKQSQSLARLRDTLLPKLLSGELTLPDTEEPQTECQDAAHG